MNRCGKVDGKKSEKIGCSEKKKINELLVERLMLDAFRNLKLFGEEVKNVRNQDRNK